MTNSADIANRLIAVVAHYVPGTRMGVLEILSEQYGVDEDQMVGILRDLVDLRYLDRRPDAVFVVGARGGTDT